MGRHFHRRHYKVRPAGSGRGIELSLPSRLKNEGIIRAGDVLDVYFDDSVIVITPPNKTVDVERLAAALDLVGV